MELHHVCQIELRVRDLARSTEFLTRAFGWPVTPAGGGYAMMKTGADPVVGVLQLPNERAPLGVCPYVLVEDCAAQLAKAQELGASVMWPTTDAGAGLFAQLWDPWGGEIGLWQPANTWASGNTSVAPPRFCWLEIPCAELAEGVRFYRQLFGWSFTVTPEQEHLAFVQERGRAVGIGLISGPSGAKVRGTTSYVGVANMAAALQSVEDAGGSILRDPSGSPGGGRFAIFHDPDGNRLGLFAEPG